MIKIEKMLPIVEIWKDIGWVNEGIMVRATRILVSFLETTDFLYDFGFLMVVNKDYSSLRQCLSCTSESSFDVVRFDEVSSRILNDPSCSSQKNDFCCWMLDGWSEDAITLQVFL